MSQRGYRSDLLKTLRQRPSRALAETGTSSHWKRDGQSPHTGHRRPYHAHLRL